MVREEFINSIARYAQKYASKYNICVVSPIVAQAICETGWNAIDNETGLFPYNNFFGLKCGKSWKGKAVDKWTHEEYTPGVSTSIVDKFRVYDSFEQGVEGYFKFINWSNYANLKGVTDPYQYIVNIKADDYATSSTYVSTIWNIVQSYNLTKYDNFDNGAVEQPEQPKQPSKSVDELANEVIKGLWGNNPDRRNRLEAEGYNYNEVQARVDSILNGNQPQPEPQPQPVAPSISVGDTVRVTNAINYDNGKPFKCWYDTFDVISVSGDRVVIGKGKTVTSAIDISNIERV